MEVNDVVQVFSKLADCTSTRQLFQTMQNLVEQDFENTSIHLHELMPARIVDDSQRSKVLYKDAHSQVIEGKIDEREGFREAFDSKEPVKKMHDSGLNELVFPVVLSDLNISHLVSVRTQIDRCEAEPLVEQIVLVFVKLFKAFHEKSYDPLTRVLNRQAFEDACLGLSYYSGKKPSHVNPFTVVAILDIDNFKAINDRYGHAIGDEVLVLFCRKIASISRDEDQFFRYGGEEFVLFLRGRDSSNAEQVLERYRQSIDTTRFPQVENLTVSIGFAPLCHSMHPNTQLAKADRALYYAKNNGKNQVLGYESLVSEGKIKAVKDAPVESEFWDD